MDWIPRTLRQKQKRVDAAYRKIELETGRPATDEEIAKELEISLDELDEWQNQTKISNLISLDDYMEQGETKVDIASSEDYVQPEKVVEQQALKQILVDALELLTEKEKKVIVFYYYEELTLKEISSILEVTESRVSQLHTKALQKLRNKLGNNVSIFMGN
mgnify:FL=1